MEWISVEDRLPDKSNDYLIHTIENYEYVAFWSKIWESKNYWQWTIRCQCCNPEDDLLIQDTVTHWMPLPEPPKE